MITHENIWLTLLKGGATRKYRDIIGNATKEYIRNLYGIPVGDTDPQTMLICSELNSEGISILGETLDSTTVSSILNQLKNLKINLKNKSTGKIIDSIFIDTPNDIPNNYYGYYQCLDLLKIPEVISLINDPNVFKIPLHYFNALPTLSSVACWWTTPAQKPEGAQFFHQDRGDFTSLNLFIYLTDVDKNSGPHEYCKKTHKYHLLEKIYQANKEKLGISEDIFWEWIEIHRKNDNDIEKIFSITSIIGKSGTGFFEDTIGYHRGLIPLSKPRLCFELVWTLIPAFNSEFGSPKLTLNKKNEVGALINRLAYNYN